jgi:DNA-binding transcriptional MerR regulator
MILDGIGAVSEETGLSKSSLRRYESLGFISPGRIDFGNTWVRVYSREQVALLKEVKRLIDQGYRSRSAFERAGEDIATE